MYQDREEEQIERMRLELDGNLITNSYLTGEMMMDLEEWPNFQFVKKSGMMCLHKKKIGNYCVRHAAQGREQDERKEAGKSALETKKAQP